MDIFLIILAILFALFGIIGSLIPVLPGPPLSIIALFLAKFSGLIPLSFTTIIIYILIVIAATIFDYIAPVWFPKKLGGSANAVRFSTLGLIFGLIFFPPFGIIAGPFIGAFIGEFIDSRKIRNAIKIAIVSFIAFLMTTGIKLIMSGLILYKIIAGLF